MPSSRAAARTAGLDIVASLDEVRGDWLALQAAAPASPYQSYAFCRAWLETEGAGLGAKPLIAITHGPNGEPTALLPLSLRRRGPLTVAEFVGQRMANYQMGLFCAPETWAKADVAALLNSIGRKARVDLYAFTRQPVEWRGRPNPLALLGGRPSPSFAYATRLGADVAAWTNAHYSAAQRKKRRSKTRKLEALGVVSHRRADSLPERREAMAAFLTHKAARQASLALPNEFDAAPARAFISALAALDGGEPQAGFEFHTISAGERIVSAFAGLKCGDRLSGLLFSHDVADDVAPASPGELLIHELAADAIRRGVVELDFGVGEARYKSECCEIVEPLIDAAFPVTLLGRAHALAFDAESLIRRRIKQNPRLFDLARFLQRQAFKRRAR